MELSNLTRTAQLLVENPGVFCRGVRSRWRARRGLPADADLLSINGIQVPYRKEFASYLNNLYHGARDVANRSLMEHWLRPGDTMIDVGANIGRTSVIALGCVGAAGQVHSFEPVPRYYEMLCAIQRANPSCQLVIQSAAVGDRNGTTPITLCRDNIGANTLIPQLLAEWETASTLEVPIVRLDEYIQANGLKRVTLIVIDAEGYEFPVLRGLERYWQAGFRPRIICELHARSGRYLGYTSDDLMEYLASYDYTVRRVLNPRKQIHVRDVEAGDVILIPKNKSR
ncbi:MAG: FkbM family methyltransferase [Sedimentisphaerales bacterium]|nr:FkbM family methyltransferase [Sedimentisphaerales bacterium]